MMVEPFRWGPYCEAWECDLCGGCYDPPCPFHPDATPLNVFVETMKRWAWVVYWHLMLAGQSATDERTTP